MIPVLLFLSLAPAECIVTNHGCQAARYIELAREEPDHASRVTRLYFAHREYLFLFDATQERAALCRAREVLSEARALKPTPEHLVERFRKSEGEASERERKAGIDCAPKKKKKSAAAPRLASKPRLEPKDAETPAPAIAAVIEVAVVDPPPSEEPPPPLLPANAAAALPATADATNAPTKADLSSVAAQSTGPRPASPDQHPERRSRGLMIAGGMTFSAGLALSGTAGFLGDRLLDTWRDSQALHEEVGPFGTEAQAAEHAAVARDHQQRRASMFATAFVGGSALVVGAVLFGVGAKRLSRVASRTALLPMPGGLAFRARF